MIPEPYVSMLVVRGLVHAAETAGASRSDVARELGMAVEQIDDPDARVRWSDMLRIAEQILVASKDPALGLHWVDSLRERSFGSVTHMLAYSSSLRHGYDLIAQFQPLIFQGDPVFQLSENTDTFSVRHTHLQEGSARVQRFAAELAMSCQLKLVRTYFSTAPALHVHFAHAAPAHAHAYERLFGPVVRFDQPHTEIAFERGLLDARSPHADVAMYEAQKTIAERRLLQLGQHASYALRVRELLLERVPARLSMARVARVLGLSERSLRNHLAAEGTSYREVECGALGTAARQLLQDPQRTIQQTAYEMGFADATTFHRAVKRWTGMTPSALRGLQVGRTR